MTTIRALRRFQWAIVAALAIAVVVLGAIGLRQHWQNIGRQWRWTDLVYETLRLFIYRFVSDGEPLPLSLEIARFIAPVVAGWTALGAFFRLNQERLRQTAALFMKDHTVVCGLGSAGHAFLFELRSNGHRVVAIDDDPSEATRQACSRLGVPLLVGDAGDTSVLRSARVERATRVLCTAGTDATNIEVAIAATELATRPLTVHAHVQDPDLCQMLRRELFRHPRPSLIDYDFFSLSEQVALRLLQQSSQWPLTDLVVLGGGRLAATIITRSLSLPAQPGGRRRVYVVQPGAHDLVEGFTETSEVELHAIDADPDDLSWLANEGIDQATILVVEHDDDAASLRLAMRLAERVSGTAADAPIAMSLRELMGISRVVDHDASLSGIHPISYYSHTCTVELLEGGTVELIASAMHRIYLTERAGQLPPDDPAARDWSELPEALRESNRSQARDISRKLQLVGLDVAPIGTWRANDFTFTDAEVDVLARREHERWASERTAAGYTLGVRDHDRKTSPYLVPFDELEPEIQEIDRQTVRSIPTLLAEAGFQIIDVSRGTDADE